MYEVEFYKNRKGREPVLEYLKKLTAAAQNDKESRIKYKKIREYIDFLKNFGTRIGEPVVKHIDGNIWELRPTDDRIFFFLWHDNIFILLHHYKKKTKKTPPREIDQAKRNRDDFLKSNK